VDILDVHVNVIVIAISIDKMHPEKPNKIDLTFIDNTDYNLYIDDTVPIRVLRNHLMRYDWYLHDEIAGRRANNDKPSSFHNLSTVTLDQMRDRLHYLLELLEDMLVE
jgi:hypothetical protein